MCYSPDAVMGLLLLENTRQVLGSLLQRRPPAAPPALPAATRASLAAARAVLLRPRKRKPLMRQACVPPCVSCEHTISTSADQAEGGSSAATRMLLQLSMGRLKNAMCVWVC